MIQTLFRFIPEFSPLRPLSRKLLQAWAWSNKAPGYLYQCMEEKGPRLASGKSLYSNLPNGCVVACDLNDHVERHIYFLGAYEPVESYLFTSLIEPGQTVIDIGANVGQYSLLASKKVGEKGRVYAFEPVPANFQRLSENIRRNAINNIVLNRMAVWHENTTVNLGLHQAEDIQENHGSFAIGGTASSVTAPAIVLDDFVKANQLTRIDFIKMDIEGAEGFAIRGMQQTLANFKPAILMEVNREACSLLGYDPQIFWDVLVNQLHYRAWSIGQSAKEWAEIESAQTIDRANILFVRGPVPERIASGWNLKTCLRWARR